MKLTEDRKRQLIDECSFAATRSSGPGGQNVNKVNTQVELRFSVGNSLNLSDIEKSRVFVKLKNRINSGAELVLVSQSERSQLGNKEMVTEKFIGHLEKALTVPKKRRKTSPTAASRRKRAEAKKKLSQKKQLRKPPEA